MKKNYLLTGLLVLGLSFASKAQQHSSSANAQALPKISKLNAPKDPSNIRYKGSNSITNQKAMPFYSNSFPPTGVNSWVKSGSGPTGAVWNVNATGPGLIPQYKFQASQGSYGWLLSLNVPGAYNRDLTSPVINCSGHANISLRFKQIYVKYQDVTKVQVSNDGGTTFTDFAITANDNMGLNDERGSNTSPDVQEIDISSVAGNQANVKIRFNIVGDNDYFWLVDDVELVDILPHDLAVGGIFYTNWYGSGNSMTPKSQVDSINFGLEVTNKGFETAADITVNHTITGAGSDTRGFTYTGINFLNGDTDTLSSAVTRVSRYAPFNIGTYNVEMTASTPDIDDDLSNNTATNTFMVTDSVFAKEYGNCNTYLYGIRGNSPKYMKSFPFIIANSYRCVKNTSATSISFAVSEVTSWSVAGAKMRVSLQTFNAGAYTTVATSGIYTLTNADRPTSSSNIDKFVTIGLPATALTSNTTYYACVERVIENPSDSANWVFILSADNVVNKNRLYASDSEIGYDNSTVIFSYIAGSATPETLPYTAGEDQAAIRLNVTPICASSTITATVLLTQPTCLLSNGEVSVSSPLGGTAPYAYSWNLPSLGTSSSVSGLAPGTYTVNINDANGCLKAYSNVLVNTGTPSTLSIVATNSTGCGASLGELNVTGANPNSYLWSDLASQTVNPATGLSAGTYMVTFTNTSSCSSVISGVVSDGNAPVLTVGTITSITCNGNNSGAITLNVSTPFAGVVTYTWNPGVTTSVPSISGLAVGTYNVSATDGSCSSSLATTVVVSQPTALVGGSLIKSDLSCFGGANGSAVVSSVSGGKAPYSYTWTNTTQTGSTITGLGAGTYNVVVKDANSCILTPAIAAATITEPAAISFTATPTLSTSGVKKVSITISGGTPPYTLTATTGTVSSINPAAGTSNITLSVGGDNTLTLTDSKGCVKTVDVVGVGVKEVNSVSNLSVFPNPTDNNVTINFNSSEAKNVTVKLISLNGQEIFTQELPQFIGEYSKTVNMSTQAQGVYFLQIVSDKNVTTKKVVKL